jgi:hypothetical protein
LVESAKLCIASTARRTLIESSRLCGLHQAERRMQAAIVRGTDFFI